MKVFAYLRVSTSAQLDGGGFERQLDTIKVLCAARGWTIARTFRDQQSGCTEFDDRSGLHEILSLAGEGSALGIDTVIVENASRVARDLMVQEIFLCECRKRGIKVYAADCGEELVMDGADPSRVMIRQILGAVSQYEKAMTVLKLQAGRRKKARETGRPCGGPKQYGTTAGERAILTDIKMRRRQGKTFQEIANEMREIGYPAPRGGYWHRSTVWTILTRDAERKAAQNRFDQDNDQ
jgi:DNA invertase Pin-like site-specific DNA recombinase